MRTAEEWHAEVMATKGLDTASCAAFAEKYPTMVDFIRAIQNDALQSVREPETSFSESLQSYEDLRRGLDLNRRD